MIKKVTRHLVLSIDQKTGKKTTLEISFHREKSSILVGYYLYKPEKSIIREEESINPDTPEYILAVALYLNQIFGDAEEFAFRYFHNRYLEKFNTLNG